MPIRTMSQAVKEAIHSEMLRDDRVILYGESVEGGVAGADTVGLAAEFGPLRCFDTPIAENSMAGMAIGLAVNGYRPIVQQQVGGFVFGGFEESVPIAAGWRLTHGGAVALPMVWLLPTGPAGGTGNDHSVHPSGTFAHFPGIKVVVPSNAADAKGLMTRAIRDDNPVAFMVHQALSRQRCEVPEGEHDLPFGVANVARAGDRVTVVSSSFSTALALQAATELEQEISVEVIDLRTLVPLDLDAILNSVAKTGRLVVADDDVARCGMSAEVSALVAERAFSSLHAPIMRVARANVPLPAGKLEAHYAPSVAALTSAIRSVDKY
jgi:acetoin:2,6-dichlorophenolindophenol oxidoreductase subunit beta